jgi:hypothetical protein
VVVTLGPDAAAAAPAVARDGPGAADVGGEEARQALGRGVRKDGQPQAPEAAPLGLAAAGLDRAGDHRLAGGAAAGTAGPRPAHERLVGLDPVAQRLAAGPHHGAADLVQPAPGRLVAAEARLPPQLDRRDAALARGDEVDRQKPLGQATLGLLEDGPGQGRARLAAGPASSIGRFQWL